ncbi:MAG: hypothetical protein IT168_22065 [Bryobacterales bacterium]|nr:hypothetical protein [Bryobacterales bacterium]
MFVIAFLLAATAWITDVGGRVTTNAKGEVTGIHLRGAFVSDSDLDAIAAMPTLEVIDLSQTRVTDLGLLRLKALPNVRELNLFYAELVTDEGLAVLRNWSRIERLNLRGTKVTDNTLSILAGKNTVKSLDIGYAEVTDSGLQNLVRMKGLRELAFGGNKLTEVGLEVLRSLPQLTKLDIAGQQRTDSGLWFVSLTDIGLDPIATLTELRELNLSSTPVSAKGIQRLATLKKLEKLNLYKARRITDDAVPQLAALPALRWVDIKDTAMTAQGVAALRKAHPHLTVQGDPAQEPLVTSVEFENFLFRALLLADPSEKPDVNAYVDVDLKTNPPRRLRVELRDHAAQRFDGTQPAETDNVRIAQIACPARANCAQSSFPALDINPVTGAIMFHRKGAAARYNEAPLPLGLIRIEWKGKTEF